MKKISALFYTVVCLFLTTSSLNAQFNTPNIDGTISANEYGSHIDGQNQKNTSSAQTWYLSWDNTNLYVAVTNANLSEAAVIAIDRNPVSPPNGGTNADGTLNALNYDSTAIGTYPFRADFRAYFKDGYRDYNTANGANGWNFGASGFGSYASGAGNVRELGDSLVGNHGRRTTGFIFIFGLFEFERRLYLRASSAGQQRREFSRKLQSLLRGRQYRKRNGDKTFFARPDDQHGRYSISRSETRHI